MEDVRYVRTDAFYDLHVPIWNHYEAHGILHHNSGKTYCAHAVAVKLSLLNQGFTGCVLEPTGDMVRRIWVPKFEDFLDHYQIPYTPRYSPYIQHILHLPQGDATVLGLSFENSSRIVGDDWAWALVDEIDTVKTHLAQRGYDKVLGRIRVGNFQQLHCYSTPEGFGFHYQTYGTEKARQGKRRVLLRMRTADNAHNLRPGFIDDLLSRYTKEQCNAYLEGIYQNLTTGSVYDRFDRHKHVRELPLLLDRFGRPFQQQTQGRPCDDETILAGIDFNIQNTNAVLFVRRGEDFWAFDEVAGAHDTDDLGRQIRERYPDHRILMYPDASGAKRTTNATRSDVAILESYGLSNMAPSANPPVRDRVAAVQALLENGKGETHLFLTPNCPKTIEDLELQSYTDKGEPDKESGHDHRCECVGYVCHRVKAVENAQAGRKVGSIRLY